jgi:hypothetical protein
VVTTRWGSAPENVTCTLNDVTTEPAVDVSTTCLDGTLTVDGDVISLPRVQNLETGHLYWLECEFDLPDDVPAHLSFYLQILCVT